MSYDDWKCTPPSIDEMGDSPEDTCFCGQPLDGGEDGMCSDCVRALLRNDSKTVEELTWEARINAQEDAREAYKDAMSYWDEHDSE